MKIHSWFVDLAIVAEDALFSSQVSIKGCFVLSTPGSRSGEITSRPTSALSQHNGSSGVVSSTARPRPATAPIRKPRPNSIAITGVTSSADILKGLYSMPCYVARVYAETRQISCVDAR